MTSKTVTTTCTILILAVSLLSCTVQSQANEVTPTPPPTSEPLETSTADVPTPSSLPTSTATAAKVEVECQNYVVDNQSVGNGFLLVKDSRVNYYVIDVQNMRIESFLTGPVQISFSMDGQAFAYASINETNRALTVKSPDGSVTIPWQDNWYSLARWVDGRHIQINESDSPVSPQIILNPFENTSTRVIPDFTDVYNLDSKINWGGLSLVSYSSNMRYAVYPRLSDDLALVLVPTYENGVIARLSPIDITSYPQWSSYGLFIIGEPIRLDKNGQLPGYDLFQIGLNGGVNRITDFSETYEYPLIRHYRWSPNYDDISFWFSTNSHELNSAYLGFTNITNRTTTLACINTNNIEFATPPVWSPDGRLLAVTANLDEDTASLLVVNPVDLKFRILDFQRELFPVGWISFEP